MNCDRLFFCENCGVRTNSIRSFFDELSSRRCQMTSRRAKDVQLKWPARENQFAFSEWSAQTARKKTAEAYTPMTRKDLQSLKYNINYNIPAERTVVPWLPVGSDNNGEIYVHTGFVPAAYRLRKLQDLPRGSVEECSRRH